LRLAFDDGAVVAQRARRASGKWAQQETDMADRSDTFYAVADEAIHGYGAQLLVGDGASPETFQAIAGLKSITPGEMTTADIDVTHLRSPDAHREHRAGIRDSGAFTCTGVWLPLDESQSNTGGGSGSFTSGGMIAIWRARENRNYIIRLNNVPAGSPAQQYELPFRAYCSQFQPGEIGIEPTIDFTVSLMPNAAYDSDLL
jgi:hypothetical protein